MTILPWKVSRNSWSISLDYYKSFSKPCWTCWIIPLSWCKKDHNMTLKYYPSHMSYGSTRDQRAGDQLSIPEAPMGHFFLLASCLPLTWPGVPGLKCFFIMVPSWIRHAIDGDRPGEAELATYGRHLTILRDTLTICNQDALPAWTLEIEKAEERRSCCTSLKLRCNIFKTV